MILLHRNLYNDWLNLTPDDISYANYNLKDCNFIAYNHIHKFIKFTVRKLNRHLEGNELSLVSAIYLADFSYTNEDSDRPIKAYRDVYSNQVDENKEDLRKQKYEWAETDLPQLNQLFLKAYYSLNNKQLCNSIDSHNGKKQTKDVIMDYFFDLSVHYYKDNVKFIFPITALNNFIDNYCSHGYFNNTSDIFDDKYTFIVNSSIDLNELVDLLFTMLHYELVANRPVTFWQHCLFKLKIDQEMFLSYIQQFRSYHNEVIDEITDILLQIYNKQLSI